MSRLTVQEYNKTTPRTVVGASILPYCISPKHGEVYFLLGKERHHAHWPGSDKWSGFGGRADPHETPENTAAREFVEETSASVRYFLEDVLPRQRYDDIAQSLRDKRYAARFTISHGADTSFVMFVTQIPWDPSSISRFSANRHMLTRPSQYSHMYEWKQSLSGTPAITNGLVDKVFLEKQAIALWSPMQLQRASETNGMLTTHEYCRKEFYEVLSIILTELRFLQYIA